MVTEAASLKWSELSSELEALLVEAELIHAHQPHYNILLKDDKSPLYIVITDEPFPRVLTAHKRKVVSMQGIKRMFGPFPSSLQVRYVLHEARRIFQWCNEREKNNTACFYVHLQLCGGACAGKVTQEEYALMIQRLIAFLRGRTQDLTHEMKAEMKIASELQHYERAAILRDQLAMLAYVTTNKRPLPLDMKLPQLMQKEADEMMVQLRRLLQMHMSLPPNYPLHRIEGYDISNTQGTKPVAAMVVAIDGQMDNSEYKMFNIQLGEKPNDYGMMKEALLRRQKHPEWGIPNLVMLDGGKGQLRAGVAVWGWSVPLCALAKEPDRVFFYNPQTKEFTMTALTDGEPASTLLRRVRDEAHRFSKRQHSRRRTRAVIE